MFFKCFFFSQKKSMSTVYFLIPCSFFLQIQLVTLDHRFHFFSEILDSGFAIDFGAPGMDEEPLLLKTFMQSYCNLHLKYLFGRRHPVTTAFCPKVTHSNFSQVADFLFLIEFTLESNGLPQNIMQQNNIDYFQRIPVE